MALGHFLMAIEAAFLFALLALIVGVGAVQGQYRDARSASSTAENDLRRAMAFQIFYIFINVSVIAAPLISGTLGQKVGWHYGFGCAGVVMVLGLFIYLCGPALAAGRQARRARQRPRPRESRCRATTGRASSTWSS